MPPSPKNWNSHAKVFTLGDNDCKLRVMRCAKTLLCVTGRLKPTRCFRTRGKKGERHAEPDDPPRRRANKRRGHGTYQNDRPPIVGTIGRRSGKCRLRVCQHTDQRTLTRHVEKYTRPETTCYSDEWPGYNALSRPHASVSHGEKEWARDDDGDGIREVHVNTIEGLWTSLRNFLRPFRGVHKKYLKYYVVMCEHSINRKRISPTFIAQLVGAH